MNILLLFGPCEIWRDIVWGGDWDCTDHSSPMSLVVYIALLIGGAVTVYFTMFHGETEKAAPAFATGAAPAAPNFCTRSLPVSAT